MNKLKFKSRISTSGHSKVITIPAYLVKNELIDPSKEYYISITEKKEGEKNEDKYRSNNV